MVGYVVLGIPRSPVAVALKDVLTLGIYGKVWLYRINRELDGHLRFKLNFPLLAVLVALPLITPLFVKWGTLKRLHKGLREHVTMEAPKPLTLFIIGLVPVLGTAAWTAWAQSLLNHHWFWHKREELIAAKAHRIGELRPQEHEARIRARIGRLEKEVARLREEVQRELAVAGERQSRKPKRERKPLRLPRPKLPKLTYKRKKAPEEPEAASAAEAAEGPTDREQKRAEKRRRKEEKRAAKRAARSEQRAAKEARKTEKAAKKRAAEPEEAPAAPTPGEAPAIQVAAGGPAPAPTPAPAPAPRPTAPMPPPAPRPAAAAPAPAARPAPVKVLTLRCPRCSTRIPDVRKPAGQTVQVTCPTCAFQAAV